MKLLTHVDANGVRIKLHDCAGYIPVYNSIKKAEKLAGNKYSIQIIDIIKA